MKIRNEEDFAGRKAGKIYLEAAKRLLWQYYFNSPATEGTCKNVNFMQEEKYYELLNEADFCKLEGAVWAKEYLSAAASTLEAILQDHGVNISRCLVDVALFSQHPYQDLEECREAIEPLHLNNGEKAAIVYKVMVNVHDQRVWDLAEHFFLMYRLYQNYQFMPIELVGLNYYKRIYETFVKSLLEAAGLAPDMTYIERAYTTQQDAFFEKYTIRDYSSLKEALLEGSISCGAWCQSIRDAIKYDPKTRDRLASQIVEQNPILKI